MSAFAHGGFLLSRGSCGPASRFAGLGLAVALALAPTGADAGDLPLHILPPAAWSSAVPLAHGDLSRVLEHWSLDPAGLSPDAGTTAAEYLLHYLSQLASVGPGQRPELFPSEQHVLAYLVDAHIAWALAFASNPRTARLDTAALRDRPFTLGQQTWTLSTLSAEVLRRAPLEPRLALFLNPGIADGPPLPLAPLEGHSLEWQLAEHAGRCGRSPGFWQLDAAAGTVHLSGFAAYLPGLPQPPAARARRLLELVPPPAELGREILARCGRALQRCTVTVGPINLTRWAPRHPMVAPPPGAPRAAPPSR